jgi:hypothetical protein
MTTKTFAERCALSEQCLPDAPYRAMLAALHKDMLLEIDRLKAAQPLVQEPKELFGYEIWNRFYRSKPELLDEMVRPNAGYPLDWIEANIREVYVHGTYALAEKGNTP